MKIIFSLLLLFTMGLNAQTFRSEAEPLKVEWKTEFTDGESGISGLVLHNENIYVTQTGNASVFNIFDKDGALTFTGAANNTRIRSLFLYDSFIYSMGDQHLTKRDFNGSRLEEHLLLWKDGEYISSLNGAILNNNAYAFAFGDLIKFSMNGEQKFRKEVANSCNSQNLRVGGNFIYLYGQISDPALGARLMQYDTVGNQKWSLPMGMVTNIFADKDGNCYVFSAQPQTSNIVSKFNSAGKEIWSRVVPGQVVLNGYLYQDTLFVCGSESIDAAQGRHQNPTYSILSTKDGQILNQQTLDFYQDEQGFGEGFSQVAFDGKSLYFGGHSGSQQVKYFLVKLSNEGNTTGLIDEKSSRSSYSIFPNPGGSKFTISCAETSTATLKIAVRNSLGQVIQKKEISCNGEKCWQLDLGKQPAGNYTVEIQSGAGKTVKKIVVE